MTGTASELFDYSNEIPGKSGNARLHIGKPSNIDLLSAWIYGRISADCVLNDISESGCSVLLPEQEPIPSSTFKLIIMSPDNNKSVHSILCSQVRWQEDGFTRMHKKIGIEFLHITAELRSEINALRPFFYNANHQQIKCSLLKSKAC